MFEMTPDHRAIVEVSRQFADEFLAPTPSNGTGPDTFRPTSSVRVPSWALAECTYGRMLAALG